MVGASLRKEYGLETVGGFAGQIHCCQHEAGILA